MASYKTLLIPLIQEILVKEIGEANIPPLKWTRLSPTRYKFLVDIGEFTQVVTVEFEQLESSIEKQLYFPPKYRQLNNIYNVGFDVAGTETQFAKTDLKTLLSILSTVVDIVKDFISYMDRIDGLFIMASPKELDSKDISQKSNLYKAFISKQLQSIPDFDFDTYKDGFILIKK